MFGGPTPDALAALVAMLATLRDNRGTPQSEVSTTPRPGTVSCIRLSNSEATPAYGRVSLVGDGSVSDMLWARPAVTILGIDCPPVLGSTAAIVPRAAARLNLRIPPGMAPDQARDALVDHLRAVVPWGVHRRH